MKIFKKVTMLGVSSLFMISLAGCGAAQTNTKSSSSEAPKASTTQNSQSTANNNAASKTPSKTVTIGAQQYQGKDKLASFEAMASKNNKDEKAQIEAGVSAFVNGDINKAKSYYNKAIQINPKDAVPYNNLGNIYLRTLKQPKEALTYYQKATSVDPKYAFGWINLVLCQQALGDNAKAKEAVHQGLASVPKNDPNYKALSTISATMK